MFWRYLILFSFWIRCFLKHIFGLFVIQTDEDGNLSCKMYEGFSNYKYNRNFNHFPSGSTSMTASPLKRYFIALASESLIKKGVFFRFRKRTRVSMFVYGEDTIAIIMNLEIILLTIFHICMSSLGRPSVSIPWSPGSLHIFQTGGEESSWNIPGQDQLRRFAALERAAGGCLWKSHGRSTEDNDRAIQSSCGLLLYCRWNYCE